MNIFLKIWHKVKRKWTKIRLLPIRVFCFHHVCKTFDTEVMNQGDWMQIDEFKNKVFSMQEGGVEFISLAEAYKHICNDWFRYKKYAVLSFDDGYATLKELLPWLEEQRIPATLFINGKYLDGESYRNNPNEKYLNNEEVFELTSSLIEIGSHGWEHADASKMSDDEFKQIIEQNIQLLHTHPRYVPFHAYTWGRHTSKANAYLLSHGIKPVYIDGAMNFCDSKVIHRELI